MKVALLADLHIGVKKGDQTFFDSQYRFYKEQLVPELNTSKVKDPYLFRAVDGAVVLEAEDCYGNVARAQAVLTIKVDEAPQILGLEDIVLERNVGIKHAVGVFFAADIGPELHGGARALARVADKVSYFAQKEGLGAHARSATVRFEEA